MKRDTTQTSHAATPCIAWGAPPLNSNTNGNKGEPRLTSMAKRTSAANQDGASAHRLSLLVVGMLIGAFALFAFASNATAAVTSRAQVAAFGPDGMAASSFGFISQLAFDQTNDKLYVLDRKSPAEVHSFDAPGLAPTGSPFPLSVPFPGGEPDIAADSSSHNLYFLAENSEGLYGFDSATGAGLPGLSPKGGLSDPCGLGVDSAGGIWVGNYFSESVQEYDSSGTPGTAVDTSGEGNGHPCHIAFDSNDNMFVAFYGGGGVYKYNAPSYSTATLIDSATTRAIAADTTTNTIYVAHPNDVVAYNATDGTPKYSFAYGFSNGSIVGVTADEGADTVYVSVAGSPKAQVYAFSAAQNYSDATGTADSATPSYFSAELSGTVDDNNALQTAWQLQVSSNGGTTWKTAASGRTAGDEVGAAVSGTATGLSLNTDYQFRILTNKGPSATTAVASSVVSFKTLSHPDATSVAEGATNITHNSADLNGTVTDNGPLPTNWKIQLSGDGGANWTTVESGVTGGEETNAAVSATAEGLNSGAKYSMRVVTNKGPGSSDVPSGAKVFSAVATSPALSGIGAVAVSDTSARLVATVDPRNSATAYVIEYGDTPALGKATSPVSIGAGTTPLTVSQVVGNLTPDTTYYFRITATNLVGSASSGSGTLHTLTTPLPLPENRAYEQVSPVDKNGNDVDANNALLNGYVMNAAWNGEAAMFCSTAQFGEPPSPAMTTGCNHYVSRRGPDGWTTSALTPLACSYNHDAEAGKYFAYTRGLSPNMDKYVVSHPDLPAESSCKIPPLDPNAATPGNNLYLGTLTAGSPTYQLLNPANGLLVVSAFLAASYQSASDDFEHVVYASTGRQTPDAPFGFSEKLYDWTENGLSLISIDPAGEPFQASSSTPISARNGVSATGDRIFIQNPAYYGPQNEPALCTSGNECKLYLREENKTVEVSQPECSSACGGPEGAKEFLMATPDGSKAYFRTTEKLTDDDTSASGQDLYMYTDSTDPAVDQNLTLLSQDKEPGDGLNAGVASVFQPSDDGNTVFFVATGQIVAGEPTDPGYKLYRWQFNGGNPTIDYLATLAGSDDQYNWAPSTPGSFGSDSNNAIPRLVTPDGRVLMVNTRVPLDPVADQDSDVDVYRWTEADGFQCVSCQLPGVPSMGNSAPTPRVGKIIEPGFRHDLFESQIFMSDDGDRIVFDSSDALVPEDTNGNDTCRTIGNPPIPTCQDVYEWHDGTVSLITDGKTNESSYTIGMGKSGRDIFFVTGDKLVGWDTDPFTDVYDARIGGGLPEPPATGAPCEGEGCRGAASSAPSSPGAGTAAFQGPGNPPPDQKAKRRCPQGKRQARLHGKTRCVAKRHHKRDRTAKNNRRAAR